MEWFQRAADQGHPDAQLNLAWFYLHGEGVDKDLAEATRLCHLAAEQGNAKATEMLAEIEQA